jgi:MFS family permease
VAGEVADRRKTVRDEATPSTRGRRIWLAVYLTSATLVRSASGGAPVGLVSLTLGTHRGAALGGILAALLTAPNVAGPWMARWLESVRDPRRMLSCAFAVYGFALACGALLLGRVPAIVVAVLITFGGLCDPLMTGGLSSRLALIVGGEQRAQRRAEGWDSATYGVSTILGPTVVAALAAVTGPLTAVLGLGGSAVLAGLLLLLLPAEQAVSAAGAAMAVRDTIKLVVGFGPLRRVTTATMITSLSTGGVLVIAVVLGRQLDHSSAAGAALAAVYGVGTLCGALLTGTFPLTGEPERLAIRLIAVNAAAIGVCAAAPNYAVALLSFATAGACNAVLFTATLAVRSIYSPPAARAQVFIIMAGFKMAASAVGTALAGSLVAFGPRLVLLLDSIVVATAVAVALADRGLTRNGLAPDADAFALTKTPHEP